MTVNNDFPFIINQTEKLSKEPIESMEELQDISKGKKYRKYLIMRRDMRRDI